MRNTIALTRRMSWSWSWSLSPRSVRCLSPPTTRTCCRCLLGVAHRPYSYCLRRQGRCRASYAEGDRRGRKGNATKNSLPRDYNRAHKSAARHKPGRGARRGASEQRYRAMPGDVQRLRLLVEPRPATLRNDKDLYGMQEVRGSNPLSSTHLQLKDIFR